MSADTVCGKGVRWGRMMGSRTHPKTAGRNPSQLTSARARFWRRGKMTTRRPILRGVCIPIDNRLNL